ncbi:hypothetical protein FDZ74_09315 [bacterium]|nr:MAG: hypothetical protein FDZ74_09315 [bacterium]
MQQGNRDQPGRPGGGIIGYPLDALNEEVAYIAYHFHWDLDRIYDLPHHNRREWVQQIAHLNRRLNLTE